MCLQDTSTSVSRAGRRVMPEASLLSSFLLALLIATMALLGSAWGSKAYAVSETDIQSPDPAASTGNSQTDASELVASSMEKEADHSGENNEVTEIELKAPKVKIAKRMSYGFKASWKAIPEAKSYTVQVRSQKLTSGKWKTVAKTKKASATITMVGIRKIPAKTTLKVRVRANAGAVKSLWSGIKTIKTKGITASKHIYSHRGTGTQALSHTFAAYDLALKQGSKTIEQDVVLSKDGTLFVMHDKYFTTKSGKKYYYKDLTAKQVKMFKRANGEKIHTMQSIYNRYGDAVTYVVELKQGRALDAMVEFVQKNNPKKLIVQSNSLNTLRKVSKAMPNVKTLFLAYKKSALKKAVRKNYVDIVCMKQSLVTRANVSRIAAADKIPSAFLLNSKAAIRNAMRLGVQTYFTDNTALAVQMERQHRRYESI